LPVGSPEEAATAAAVLRAAGTRNVLVTLGPRGVQAALEGAAPALYDAPKVKAVDTTAAGDTFIGGFAAQLAQGASVDAAIRFAQRAAALSVTRAGAQPSIPTRAEVEG
jgi:ribokinase